MKPLLLLLSSPFIFSCHFSEGKKPVSAPAIASKEVRKRISLRFVGLVSYRRSYASIQFMNDEKEQNAYIVKQQRANPEATTIDDPVLHKRFQELGWARENKLLLKKFPASKKITFDFIDDAGNKANVTFDFISGRIGEHKIKAFANGDSTAIDIENTRQDLNYVFVDIIPGGNKEIVVLSECYIMNGDNFNLMVYEIQTGK